MKNLSVAHLRFVFTCKQMQKNKSRWNPLTSQTYENIQIKMHILCSQDFRLKCHEWVWIKFYVIQMKKKKKRGWNDKWMFVFSEWKNWDRRLRLLIVAHVLWLTQKHFAILFHIYGFWSVFLLHHTDNTCCVCVSLQLKLHKIASHSTVIPTSNRLLVMKWLRYIIHFCAFHNRNSKNVFHFSMLTWNQINDGD